MDFYQRSPFFLWELYVDQRSFRHPKRAKPKKKQKEMSARCISQKMRIKLAQSVHRSTIDENEKYFLDHVQSFIGGERRNEWKSGKKVQTVREKECAPIFYLKGDRFLCAWGRKKPRELLHYCYSKMWITCIISFHFSISCICVFEKNQTE